MTCHPPLFAKSFEKKAHSAHLMVQRIADKNTGENGQTRNEPAPAWICVHPRSPAAGPMFDGL
jgi:hypothetical protein